MATTQLASTDDGLAAADSPRTLREALGAFFRFPSPLILLTATLAFLALRIYLGDWRIWDAVAFAVPCLIWPFLEWSLHRYVLHIKPFHVFGVRVDPGFAQKHRAHHREPWIQWLVFLPPLVHLLAAPPLAALAFVLAPSPALAVSGLAGLFWIALIYEWTHFIVHTRIQPKSRFGQRVFRNHRMHHFRNENYWYSFTVPPIDSVLGTGPSYDEVPRSETCRTLGITENER